MAPQLGASFDGSGGERWQSNWFGSLDKIFFELAVPAPVI